MKNIFLILFLILFISGYSSTTNLPDGHEATSEHLEEHEHEDEEKVHIHADFKVYIDDREIDFSIPMYQLKAKTVHVENRIGDVMHVHKAGITIGDFFETLDIQLYNNCIIIPVEGSYCNTDDKKISFYVNGVENDEFGDYEIKDLDMILISYGEGNIEEQLESVADIAAEQE